MNDTSINILTYILEDDTEVHEIIEELLKQNNFNNYSFYSDPDEFINNLTADINICVLDHFLVGTTGLEMIKQVKAKNKYSYVIIMSGQRRFDIAVEYLNEGADKYIDKDKSDYMQTLVSYLKEGLEEARQRVDFVKFIESIKIKK